MARSRNNKSNTKHNTTTVVKDAPQRKSQNSNKGKISTRSKNDALIQSTRSNDKKKISTAATGGRGGSKGKGGRKSTSSAKKEVKAKPLTAEQLDMQMDDYMMRNEKTAEKILEDQMDDYWAKKGKTDDTEAAKDEGEVIE